MLLNLWHHVVLLSSFLLGSLLSHYCYDHPDCLRVPLRTSLHSHWRVRLLQGAEDSQRAGRGPRHEHWNHDF